MRESEIGESVKFKIFLLEIECLRLGFTFSNPSLRDTRSTSPKFHVDTPRGIWPLDRQKPSLRDSILGL